MRVEELVKRGFLKRIKPDKRMVEHELKEAEYDLEKAKISYQEGDFKWSTIKAYYAMFHAGRAILFSRGFKDRRHFAVSMFLEELAKRGEIKFSLVDSFRAGMSAREDADYGGIYFEDVALQTLQMAEEFVEEVKKILFKK